MPWAEISTTIKKIAAHSVWKEKMKGLYDLQISSVRPSCLNDLSVLPKVCFYKCPQHPFGYEPVPIIHCHLKYEGKVITFKSSDGYWVSVSGKMDKNDGSSLIKTVVRELIEETTIDRFHIRKLVPTGHSFLTLSANKAYPIHVFTFLAELHNSFKPKKIILNETELVSWQLVSIEQAIRLMDFPEMCSGLRYVAGM